MVLLNGTHYIDSIETSRMTNRFPSVRIRKRVPKAKKKYESKSVLLPLFDGYICDKTCNRYKQRQLTSLKKLQSNMALSQENGKTRMVS